MGYLTEKVAYLRGLAEGLKVDEQTNEGKMIVKILDILEELSSNFEDLSSEVLEGEARIDELESFADDMMEELGGCSCGDDCSCHGEDDDEDDFFSDLDDEDLEDFEFYEVVCPHCNEKVYFDEDMIKDDHLACPNCKKEIEIEFEEDDDKNGGDE